MARIVSGLIGSSHVADIIPLLVRPQKRPRCLSRDCVNWLQDAIAKGCTQRLAREGWRDEPAQTVAGRKQGRLWNRYKPDSMRLQFSRNSMLMLLWLTSVNAGASKATGRIRVETMTDGDHILNLLVFDRLGYARPVQQHLADKAAFKANPLVTLLFPDVATVDLDDPEVDFTPWFQPDRAWVLEALQTWLASRWVEFELESKRESKPSQLRRRGRIATAVLTAYLDAADAADRRDLAMFLIPVVGRIFEKVGQQDGRWFGRVNVQNFRMSERAEIYQVGLATFHSVSRLNRWQQEARSVSFYDDHYEASQFWLSRWENLGADDVVQRAAELIRAENPTSNIG